MMMNHTGCVVVVVMDRHGLGLIKFSIKPHACRNLQVMQLDGDTRRIVVNTVASGSAERGITKHKAHQSAGQGNSALLPSSFCPPLSYEKSANSVFGAEV